MFPKLYYYFLFALLWFTYSASWEEKEHEILNEDTSDEEDYEQIEDNDAFLNDEAKTLNQLSPEERKIRLASLIDRIDMDKDNFVTQEELKTWIQYIQQKYVHDDVENYWKNYVPPNKKSLVWNDYRKTAFGFLDGLDPEHENRHLYNKRVKQDQRRWQMADYDHDGLLTKKEFGSFLHPQLTEHMREVLVVEIMEDIDKDDDGKISLEEYIGDKYQWGEDEEEPDWVRIEREQFNLNRDWNGDGFMDQEEVRDWLVIQIFDDFHNAEIEAFYLFFELDSNSDRKLTKQEILDMYHLFLSSPVTNFGKALTYRHDEL